MKAGFVYIMGNNISTVLYIGVTNNLIRRVQEHKDSINLKSFTTRYKVTRLLYYEHFDDIPSAITREKQLKAWKRDWKMKLIKSGNPELRDLFPDLI